MIISVSFAQVFIRESKWTCRWPILFDSPRTPQPNLPRRLSTIENPLLKKRNKFLIASRECGEVEAISLTHEVPLSPQAVETFLHIVTTNISSGLLRMKGIFALSDDLERPLVAHAVQHRLHPLQRLERWPDGERSSRVVLIGQDMPIKQIRDLFEVLAPRSARKHRRVM